MKKLFISLLMLISCHTNTFAQCEPSTFVFSISPGATRSGAYLSLEGGIWPIQGKLGILAGPMMYDENVNTGKETDKVTRIDAIGRVIYKLTGTGSTCPQLVTVFGTVRGLVGASYRAYMSIGETQLIGIEPGYTSRLGAGVNIIFTTRL